MDPGVDAIGARKGLGRPPLVHHQALLLGDPVIAKPDVQAPFGQWVIGQADRHAVGAAIDHRCRLNGVFQAFQPHPQPRIAAQRIAVDAVIQDLLHARGAEDGHMGIDHGPIALVAGGRAFARMVIAHRHDHPTMGRGSGHVDVAHRIAGAVHTRTLAVPQAKDAIEFALAAQMRALGAPMCSGGQILVQARLEQNVLIRQHLLGPCHLQIDGAERRAAIARNQPRSVQSGLGIAPLLHQHQAHKRLGAIQQDRRLGDVQPIRQRNPICAHLVPSRA